MMCELHVASLTTVKETVSISFIFYFASSFCSQVSLVSVSFQSEFVCFSHSLEMFRFLSVSALVLILL